MLKNIRRNGGGCLDNWSLKDKVEVWDNDKGHWSMFHYRDIDALRRKLIEDLWAYLVHQEDDDISKIKTYWEGNHHKKDIEDIINKRFGVTLSDESVNGNEVE